MNQDFIVYSVWLRKITRLVKAGQGNACVLPINLAVVHVMDVTVLMPGLQGSRMTC